MSEDFTNLVKSKEYWKDLAPGFHIDEKEFLISQPIWEIENKVMQSLKDMVVTEGYFQLPKQNWELPIPEMAATIKNLSSKGLPLPFSFIYDEYWCLFLRIHKLLEGLLGEGYFRLPDFWTWLIDPQKNESGWRPHRDKGYWSLFPDRTPKAITVWIPLTDSTPLNGCMYLVPADRDPTYGTPDDKNWLHQPADIRAVPAEAGSLFCWNQAILHWGSHAANRVVEPRISLAFEFQSGNAEVFNQPLTKPLEIPRFESRLRLIGKQIVQYKHMYPLKPEVEVMANALIQNS